MRSRLIALALILFCTSVFNSFSQTESSRICSIKSLIGDIKIRRGSTVNWVPGRLKMPLKERDAIRTLMESEAELETTEGSVIKVGENTTLEITKLTAQSDAQSTKIKVMNGTIISNIKKLTTANSSFEFVTPTATAAIRGTIVGFTVNGESTQIKVYEGRVLVTPRGAKKGTELKNNEMATVLKNTKIIAIEKFDGKQTVFIQGEKKSDSINTTDTINGIDSSAVPADSIKSDSSKSEINDSLKSETPLKDTVKINDSYEDTTQGVINKTGTAEVQNSQLKTDSTTSYVPAVKTVEKPVVLPVKISVNSPGDGITVQPSSQILVSGVVTPQTASLVVNGKPVAVASNGNFKTTLIAPATAGELDISINAESNGSNQSVSRRVLISKPIELDLIVNSPKDGQIFSKPLIPLSGSVTPGSELSVMSTKVAVSVQGNFSGQIPIANEEGELQFDFEASLDGKTKRISRRVVFKPEFRFALLLPLEGQIVTSRTIQIKGEVQPASAEVIVSGKKMTVTQTGVYSGSITIPDEEGNVEIDIDIASGSTIKTISRTINYKRPPDTRGPMVQGVLPVVAQTPRITFTVTDPTLDDEITFYYEIDGIRESESGVPNSPFNVSLREGIHSYSVYAIDKAGNKSSTLTQKITYLGASIWNIKMRKPAGDIAINLPPSAPDNSYKPIYTIEFSIENLPDDNIQLIREVVVTNSTTSEILRKRTFMDNSFEFDIGLSLKATNVVIIEALDINNIKKTYKLQIHAR